MIVDASTDGAPVCYRKVLPAKGACWYCDKGLDRVRRFCGKACADAFGEEAGQVAMAVRR